MQKRQALRKMGFIALALAVTACGSNPADSTGTGGTGTGAGTGGAGTGGTGTGGTGTAGTGGTGTGGVGAGGANNSGANCEPDDPVVTLSQGQVCGSTSLLPVIAQGVCPAQLMQHAQPESTIYRYHNIPYAGDVSGENRWKLAPAAAPWEGVRNGKLYGPMCPQKVKDPGAPTNINCGYVGGVEDCLNLSVYTPAEPGTAAQLPVILWIHGGAYTLGTANSCLYEGSNLAAKGDVVIVAVNYRLDALGFLGGFGTGDAKAGNLGLRDQQSAMAWVKDNVAAFGGDPSNVTLWGQSAGASSVGVHLVNEESQEYFQRGAMDSNHYGMLFQTNETAGNRAKRLAALLQSAPKSRPSACTPLGEITDRFPHAPPPLPYNGCNTEGKENCGDIAGEDAQLQCMRTCGAGYVVASTPVKSVAGSLGCQGLGGFEYWAPNLDGNETAPVSTAMVNFQPWNSGAHIDKPVYAGTNAQEGVGLIALLGMWNSSLMLGIEYAAAVDAAFGQCQKPGGTSCEVLEIVPSPGRFRQASEQLGKVITDSAFGCGVNNVLMDVPPAVNVYGYFFNHNLAYNPYGADPKNPCGDHVCHSNELPLVWGNPVYLSGKWPEGSTGFTGGDLDLSNQMMGYLIEFAKTGELDDVAVYSSEAGGSYMNFQTPVQTPVGMIEGLGSASSSSFPNQQCVAAAGSPNWSQDVGWKFPPMHAEPSCVGTHN